MKKDWIIAFATEKFYVTESDARFYCEQVAKGTKFVLLKNGMMLSDKCLYVTPSESFKETEMLESGKTQCRFGKWHYGLCTCGFKYELKGNNAVQVFLEDEDES